MNLCRVGLLAMLLCGCKSHPLGPYAAPRVTGTVVDPGDHPLAGVEVIRGKPESSATPSAKGGEMMLRKPPVRTDPHGVFVLPSERVLSVVRRSGWSSVDLAFRLQGYESFSTNFPINLATNSPSGEPVLDAGLIRLSPTSTPSPARRL